MLRASSGLAVLGLVLLTSRLAQATSEFVFAANFETAPDCSSVGLSGCPGFAIETPAAQIDAGTNIGYCYAFRTPNQIAAIGRFSSVMSPLVRQVIYWQTTDAGGLPADGLAPGTFKPDCGLSTGANGRTFSWVYAAHAPVDQLRMPDDDGIAQPVAFELPANAAGFLEILYSNPSLNAVSVPPVRLVANERPAGPYTSTSTYLGVKVAISIPSDGAEHTVAGGCTVPTSPRWWWFSSQTHSFGVFTELDRLSGVTTPIVTSSGWTQPAIATFPTSPFFAFGSGDLLKFTCTYVNNSGHVVTFGEDYQNDEMCMAIAYLFPATQAQVCLQF